MTEETYQKAASAAAAMLARRPLTEYQLRQTLAEKEFWEEAVDYAVARMQVLGALDDEAYAELYLRIGTRKGWGAMRIRQELRRRGVPPEIAGQVLEQFEPDWDKMTALLDKRLGGDCSDWREVEKAKAMLARRGFSFDQIREAVRNYMEMCGE